MSGARRKARRRAVEVLYEAEVRGTTVEDVIKRRLAQTEPPINEFTERLARSVDERRGHRMRATGRRRWPGDGLRHRGGGDDDERYHRQDQSGHEMFHVNPFGGAARAPLPRYGEPLRIYLI